MASMLKHDFAQIGLLLVCISSVITQGCGQKGNNPNHPQVHPVMGEVTYQGKPVAQAQVTFFPVGGGDSAVGMTSDDGRFVLSTYRPKDGAPIGFYTIVIVAPSNEPVVPGFEHLAKGRIPPIYSDREKSPLTAEVKESGNIFNFELSDNAGQAKTKS